MPKGVPKNAKKDIRGKEGEKGSKRKNKELVS
jgi:hypothetical protein